MSLEYPCVYFDNQKCKKFEEPGYTSWCVLGPCSHETPSNADRIRAMSDEELAVFLCGIAATNCCGGCMVQEFCYAEHNGFADWVKQPVKDGDNE